MQYSCTVASNLDKIIFVFFAFLNWLVARQVTIAVNVDDILAHMPTHVVSWHGVLTVELFAPTFVMAFLVYIIGVSVVLAY